MQTECVEMQDATDLCADWKRFLERADDQHSPPPPTPTPTPTPTPSPTPGLYERKPSTK